MYVCVYIYICISSFSNYLGGAIGRDSGWQLVLEVLKASPRGAHIPQQAASPSVPAFLPCFLHPTTYHSYCPDLFI